MGCCSAKKSTKGRKVNKKGGAKASDKSKKGGKKPVTPGAKGKKGTASSKTSTSSKRPAAPKGKAPGVKGLKGGPGAKSASTLQKAPAGKRPTKTPSAGSSTKSGKSTISGKSGPPSSGSSKKKNRASAEAAAKSSSNPADVRLAKKRESHAKSLNKAGVKGLANTSADVTTATARSPPYVPKKEGSRENPVAKKIPAPPSLPSPRDNKKKKQQEKQADNSAMKKKKQDKQADKSTSESRGASASRNSDARPPRDSRRVSRAKLPMQKLTISSHIEDGIVVSQWYYTELRELGTQPSSVADLLQGGPRQQLNLQQPHQQKSAT